MLLVFKERVNHVKKSHFIILFSLPLIVSSPGKNVIYRVLFDTLKDLEG